MSTDKITEAWEIRPGWSYFLWKNLDRIADLMFIGEYAEALWNALVLCKFFPKDVKDLLEADIAEAREVFNVKGEEHDDPFHIIFAPEKLKQEKARVIVGKFVERIIEILDAKGYLEKPQGQVISYETFEKLRSEEMEE